MDQDQDHDDKLLSSADITSNHDDDDDDDDDAASVGRSLSCMTLHSRSSAGIIMLPPIMQDPLSPFSLCPCHTHESMSYKYSSTCCPSPHCDIDKLSDWLLIILVGI